MTDAGTVTYGHDGRGNLNKITNGSNITNYTCNAADQLTNVTATGVNATYAYDADGLRVKQTVGSTVTNYQWDEASTYGDVVNEYNSSGSTTASYVLGGTGLISQTRGTTTSYFLQDGQGSTRALTSSTGTVTDTYSYTAFGEQLAHTGSTTNPYQYTGQQFDTLTGLYDLRARYYNPALGRFLSQDTYPVNFGNPVELNRHGYTANDPINRADPTGHMFVEYAINLAETTVVAAGLGEMVGVLSAALCGGNLSEGAKTGFWFGAGFGAGSLVAPGVTSVAGLGLGAYGAGTSFYDMYKSGISVRNLFTALGSVAAIGFSFSGLMGAVDTYFSSSPIGNSVSSESVHIPKGTPLLGDWTDYIQTTYSYDVVETFRGKPYAIKLTEDLDVYHYWGGSSNEAGSPWYSLDPNLSPSEARSSLSLPNSNYATNVSKFVIPKDTIIIIGESSPQITSFGDYATGGGTQIYLPKPSLAQLIGRIR